MDEGWRSVIFQDKVEGLISSESILQPQGEATTCALLMPVPEPACRIAGGLRHKGVFIIKTSAKSCVRDYARWQEEACCLK